MIGYLMYILKKNETTTTDNTELAPLMLHEKMFIIQAECPIITKDATNPHFKKKY